MINAIFLTTIKYLRHIIDEKGQKPDLARATAIKNIPPPTSVSTLQAPLNQLLKKNTKWNWFSECQNTFEEIIKALMSDLSLTHYDPNKEI